MHRSEIYWADLGSAPGSRPAKRRPVLVDSVVHVTALVTLNKTDLTDWAGQLPPSLMHDVDHGLRGVLTL